MNNVKQLIIERIDILRTCLPKDGPIDRLDHHFYNEIQFLEKVLKEIERS